MNMEETINGEATHEGHSTEVDKETHIVAPLRLLFTVIVFICSFPKLIVTPVIRIVYKSTEHGTLIVYLRLRTFSW